MGVPTLIDSHALSSTLNGHESCTRVDENHKRLNKMADVSERLSDTQEENIYYYKILLI